MKILFVCTGNTCRSCMAEAIFNYYSKIQGISAYSAGVAVIKGSITSRPAALAIKQYINMNISSRVSIPLSLDILEGSDIILTMTLSIRTNLITRYPEMSNKIFSLNEYVGIDGDVIDPYGGDELTYRTTFRGLKESIMLLIDKLKEDSSIV
jgi:protein-tyrosine phosphatase